MDKSKLLDAKVQVIEWGQVAHLRESDVEWADFRFMYYDKHLRMSTASPVVVRPGRNEDEIELAFVVNPNIGDPSRNASFTFTKTAKIIKLKRKTK